MSPALLPLLLLGCPAWFDEVGVNVVEVPDEPPPPDTDWGADTDDTGTPDDTDDPTDPCEGLTDSGDAARNRATLLGCLETGGATLAAGTFPIDQGIAMPAGSTLRGDGATLVLAAPTTNTVLTVTGSNTVRDLRIDAAGNVADVNGSVLHVTGSGSDLSNLWVGDSTGGAAGYHIAGVYFIDPTSSANSVSDLEITGTFYGAIFVAGLDGSKVNLLSSAHIHDTWCDGVTFAGYGLLTDSEIHHAGVDCDNGPIPGASIYSLDNPYGGYVARNVLRDDCGNVVDLDHVSGFVFEDNTISGAGHQWDGWAPWCTGISFMMIDASANIVQRNVITNEGAWNRLDAFGDPNGVFSGAGAYADIPGGGAAIVAFSLSARESAPGLATANGIYDNELRAACAGDCVGVGYFTSRGTGYDADGAWSASTTNYFTGNDPYGSNVGSGRCGGNWYAANSTCPESPTDPACNGDDYQHTADWARNDGCYHY